MEQHRKTLRVCAFVIALAVALRLVGSGFLTPLITLLAKPSIQSFLIYLETGRTVRFSPSFEENTKPIEQTQESSPTPVEPETQAPSETEPVALAAFSADDAQSIEMKYACNYRPDLASLLASPLTWSLRSEEPTVLIIHTHATESYTRTAGEDYEEDAAFRTLDETYNMICIGQRVAEILEEGGIHVIHDRALHDYPSYNGSYADARTSSAAILAENPSIRLVLDLHRDASGDLNNQYRTYVSIDGEASAQLLFVMGTDASGQAHENWQENLSIALKLHTLLERETPGIMRPMSLRPTRFNQDLSPGALLIEVGSAGNTRAEALRAAEKLAEAILALASGTQ